MNDFVKESKESRADRRSLNARQQRYQENFKRSRRIQFGRVRIRSGGMAFCPLAAAQAVSAAGIYPAADFELVTLLPYSNRRYCPTARTRQKYRLAMSRLRFGIDEWGNPAYERLSGRRGLREWDFGKQPTVPQLRCDKMQFSKGSVGGLIREAQHGVAAMPLPATACGELFVRRDEAWTELCIRARRHGRLGTTVMYRFQADDFNRVLQSPVLTRYVRKGETICMLTADCTFYRARLRDNQNLLHQEPHRDRLQCSTAGRGKEDFLWEIGNQLWGAMLDCEQNGYGMEPLTHTFPPFLGRFNVPLDEFIDLQDWEGIPEAAAREIRKGVSWHDESFLLHRKYIPETMLPHVQNWYVDFRGHEKHLAPEIGGFILPPFPRSDETEFVYAANGVNIDATPNARYFTITHWKANQPVGTRCCCPVRRDQQPAAAQAEFVSVQ